MSVTLDDALAHLHIDTGGEEGLNLSLFVDAANEWVTSKVTDTIPESLGRLATLLLIEHWWERSQRGPASAADDGEQYADVNGNTYLIPGDVRELIDGFLTLTTSPTPRGSFPDALCHPDPVEWYG